MNISKILGGLVVTTLLGAGFASCTTDVDNPALNGKQNLLINRAPKIAAYSGNHNWGSMDLTDPFKTKRFENGDNGVSWEEIETKALDLKAESDYVDNRLPEKNGNLDGLDPDFIYFTDKEIDVELFPIYGMSSTTHYIGIYYYTPDGELIEETLWEGIYYYGDNTTSVDRIAYNEPDPDSWVEDPNHWSGMGGYYERYVNVTYRKGIKVTVPANTYFGFFFNGTSETSKQGEHRYYTSSTLNDPVHCTDGEGKILEGEPTSTIHAVTWTDNGKTYLGLEDWTDFDYQDLVFTITRELTTTDATTFNPKGGDDDGDGDDNCNKCDHPTHDPGHCDECGKFQGCNKPGSVNPADPFDPGFNVTPENPDTPDTPDQPSTPNKPAVPGDDHTNEVEVNLAVDTKGETSGGKYNESHLSIHVRSAVDVDMFIPMPLELLCPADDMEIVKKHLAGQSAHGGEFQNAQMGEDGKVIMQGGLHSMMEYEITNPATGQTWNVAVHVEYVAPETTSVHNACPRTDGFDEAGIHIWTEGLANQTDLFDYLQEAYGDGITFEIWNYFDPEADATLGDLKGYLDQATIDFIGNVLPDFFINAFGRDNYEEGKDCNVSLVEGKQSQYEEAVEGPHLNGSDKNKIYEKTTHKSAGNQTTPEA